MRYAILILSVILWSVKFVSADNNWKLELDKDGIVVYTRSSTQSDFKEFKGETTIEGSIADISSLIFDVEKYPGWCYKTSSARIISKDSVSIRYFYVSDTPFFLKTRVACFELYRENNSKTGEIIFTLKDIRCKSPISDDMLLIPVMKGYWKLTPIGKNNVKVTMQMLTEPGGIIPSWLANLVVVESPYLTLKNLTSQVKK